MVFRACLVSSAMSRVHCGKSGEVYWAFFSFSLTIFSIISLASYRDKFMQYFIYEYCWAELVLERRSDLIGLVTLRDLFAHIYFYNLNIFHHSFAL